jgi:hypothetical protein
VMSLWMIANLGEAEGAKLSILVGRNREALLKGKVHYSRSPCTN